VQKVEKEHGGSFYDKSKRVGEGEVEG